MRSFYLLAVLPLAGCAPDLGIWLLEIDAGTATECEESITHNFVDVIPPVEEEDDPNWTVQEGASESPQLAFVQVEKGDGNLCVMLWGNRVLPGTCDGSDWSFEWTQKDVGNNSQVHALGYTYSHEYDYSKKTKLTLDVSGGSATGSLTGNESTQDSYIESDMWAQAVGQPGGAMPVGAYLKTRTTDEDGNVSVDPTENSRANSECAASECTLDATESCSDDARTVRAYYYAFAEDPDYASVKGNGQTAGYPQGGGPQGGGGQ
jgi:hypothetical protein